MTWDIPFGLLLWKTKRLLADAYFLFTADMQCFQILLTLCSYLKHTSQKPNT